MANGIEPRSSETGSMARKKVNIDGGREVIFVVYVYCMAEFVDIQYLVLMFPESQKFVRPSKNIIQRVRFPSIQIFGRLGGFDLGLPPTFLSIKSVQFQLLHFYMRLKNVAPTI